MDNVRMPIETTRDGNKIIKVCVEDVYKMINRVTAAMDKAHNNSVDILDSIHKEVNGYEGELIVGTGVSQPCITDAFDEEIGMNIAFMKAKLNANLKKRNLLYRIYNQYVDVLSAIDDELEKIEDYIDLDIDGIRKHNPEYLIDKFPVEDEVQTQD